MINQVSLVLTALFAAAAVNAERVPVGESGQHDSEFRRALQEEGDQGIIGGDNVVPGSLPFYGHFQGVTMCGGALIHEDIFVTAAHCLENGFPSLITIGATTTSGTTEGQQVAVCAGLIHPNNNMKAMENDIAILKLCDPVSVTAYADYNTNPSYPSSTGEDLFIVGFGRTNPTGNLSPSLKKAKVDYLNNDTCKARYSQFEGEQNICADAPLAGICYGDSGGPLLDGNNLLVGLASFIIDTCGSSYPDFFTRVSTYSSWLDEQVCSQALTPPATCQGGAAGEADPAAGDDDEDDDDDDDESPLTACLDLLTDALGALGAGIRAIRDIF